MAKIKVESQSTGTGIYTLKTGTASTNYSATLPDATGTLINTAPSTSGNVLTSDGTNWTSAAAAAGGKVLQVVSATTTTATAVSGTYPGNIPHADTGLTLNITPTESNSDILVIITQQGSATTGAETYSVGLFRDTTNLTNTGNNVGFGPSASSYAIASMVDTQQSINYFDTTRPSGTSTITYKTKGGPYRTGTVTFQKHNFSSFITLMEISV